MYMHTCLIHSRNSFNYQAFDSLGPEDGVVPHTPVLEGKQLPMASQIQTIPCTPSEPPTSAVPQLAVSAASMQATGGE